MAKTKADQILELKSMLEASSNGHRHISERWHKERAALNGRITALERDRALLLAYVQLSEELDHCAAEPDGTIGRIDKDWHIARRALIDAGLLEGAE